MTLTLHKSIDGSDVASFHQFGEVGFSHSLYETVKFTATYLKCVSALDFPLRAAWAGHWLLGRPKQL